MTVNQPMQNPFPVLDAAGRIQGWRWLDELQTPSDRMYPTQRAALKDMLKYIDYLERGPSLWQRIWWPVRYTFWRFLGRLWRDETTGRPPR